MQVLDYLESRLLESGCTRSPQSDLESNDTKSPSRVYQHGDLLIETGASQVERFNAPPETLAYIRMLGNLDLRTLSWFEGMEVQRSGLVSMQLSRQGGILEWRKLFSERFKQSGWQEYRSFLPGIDIPVEDQVPSQSFLLNGLTIRLTYRDDRGELIKDQDAKGVMNCLMSVSLVPYEPILPGQVTSLEVRWSPVAIVYETTLSLDQLHEQLDRLYKSEGYEVTRKQSPESADTTQLVCMHADLLDLVIEFKKSGKKTLVVINETRS